MIRRIHFDVTPEFLLSLVVEGKNIPAASCLVGFPAEITVAFVEMVRHPGGRMIRVFLDVMAEEWRPHLKDGDPFQPVFRVPPPAGEPTP